jgi:hypothetical protein
MSGKSVQVLDRATTDGSSAAAPVRYTSEAANTTSTIRVGVIG